MKFDPFTVQLDDFVPFEDAKEAYLPCVYAIYGRNGLLYIGQTGEIHQRIAQHSKKRKWWPKKPRITVLRETNRSRRLITETILQLRHLPPHCRTIKLGLSAKTGEVWELQFLRATSGKS
jgi:hypothetical protein